MSLRLLVLVATLVALVLAGGGCVYDAAPQLIQVLDAAPRELEVGDRLEITGAGFPQGRPARVTFRGTLHRPGERATTGAEIATDGVVARPSEIEIAVSDAALALFCGSGDRAVHTTFEGEIEVAFAAASPTDPPVAGTLRRVTLDLRPTAPRREVEEERDAEGRRALAWLGMKVGDDAPASGGLTIASVEAGSRADEAGIAAGDVLTAFDGVRVHAPSDVVPAPGAQTSTIATRRGDDAREHERSIAVDGFRPAPPIDLFLAAAVVAGVTVFVLLFVGPSAGAFAWVERRVAARVRARRAFAFALDYVRALSLVRPAPWVLLGGGSAALLALPFGAAIGFDADVGVLVIVSLTAILTLSFVTGGFRARGAWRFGRALRATAEHAVIELPLTLAIGALVVATGTLRVQEISRAQGGAPWDWFALRNPALAVALALAYVAWLVEPDRGDDLGVDDERPAFARPRVDSPREVIFFFAEQTKLVVGAGLVAALFLGGWQVPGIAPAQLDAHRAFALIGALFFVVKAWALVAAVVWGRWALPKLDAPRMAKSCLRRLAPGALASLGAAAVWARWTPSFAAQRAIGACALVAVAVAIAYFAHRVRFGARAQERVALNPFL